MPMEFGLKTSCIFSQYKIRPHSWGKCPCKTDLNALLKVLRSVYF